MSLKIRRAIISVSDKSHLVELAQAMAETGTEIIATGNTAKVLEQAGLQVVPVEKITGSPEAFQGRMKTLTYNLCSGILYRRGDAQDEADAKKLGILPIDAVVVNFYPFESQPNNEMIDIGGPTLVRAAAKNSSHVLVVTDPAQYEDVIRELRTHQGVNQDLLERCRRRAWDRVAIYDQAIAERMGESKVIDLRYGENPHQKARMVARSDSPIEWESSQQSLSYNNILDLSAAYELARELKCEFPKRSSVVIVKHGNPCGVAVAQGMGETFQRQALEDAWAGDPVSAFGGVLCFTDPLSPLSEEFLADRFIECLAAPGDLSGKFQKKKNLKSVSIKNFKLPSRPTEMEVTVVGGKLYQQADLGLGLLADEKFECVTKAKFSEKWKGLSRFGIAVTRALQSNAIAIVRETDRGFQLVGTGPGQPNRVDSLQALAIPRAQKVLGHSDLSECVLVSDAFFPFRDSIDVAGQAGIRAIVQPGGSKRDAEVVQACDESGIAMVITGVRHFKH